MNVACLINYLCLQFPLFLVYCMALKQRLFSTIGSVYIFFHVSVCIFYIITLEVVCNFHYIYRFYHQMSLENNYD